MEEHNEELEVLLKQIEALALTSTNLNEVPPQTLGEAITVARCELGNRITIAFQTDETIVNLNSSAGPPEKVLRYLRTLGDLADALAVGALRQSVPAWLRARGVKCSIDNESTEYSKEGRTRLITGETIGYEYHATPSEGILPDMGVRIYFATSASAPFVRVGYVGQYFT